MALRRAFLTWQFVAAAVLPLWPLVGYAVWGDLLRRYPANFAIG